MNKRNPLVSIIIPAYNVEKYISKAIESTINQTYKNIEIIIINDGSTDKTNEKIKYFLNRDKRIQLINQSNKGVSNARNRALTLVKGKYVMFLDSDDWLENDAVDSLVKLAMENNDCLITCDRYFAYLNKDNTIFKEAQNNDLSIVKETKENALLNVANGKYNLQSSCYKLFDMDLINKKNLRFSNNIFHGEDGLFVFYYIYYCKSIIYIGKPLWNILEREGSATTSQYNSKWLTAINAVEEMMAFKKNTYEINLILQEYLVKRAIIVMIAALKSDCKNYEELLFLKTKIKEYKKTYFKLNHNIKDKLVCLILIYFNTDFLRILAFKKKIEIRR